MKILRKNIWDDSRRRVVVCGGCGTVRLNPMPTNKELAKLYAAYAAYSKSREPRKDYQRALVETQRRDAARQLLAVRKYIKKSDALCEIGASYGTFLKMAKPFVRRVFGFEPGLAERKELRHRGISIVENFDDAMPALDAVAMFHTIEHLNDPITYLRKVRPHIKKGGFVFVETPNLFDPLLSVYGLESFAAFYYRMEHCFYYNPHTLAGVFRRAGFRLVQTRQYQRYGIANHLHWLMAGKPGGSRKLEKIFLKIDPAYRDVLEKDGKADTFFSVFRRL